LAVNVEAGFFVAHKRSRGDKFFEIFARFCVGFGRVNERFGGVDIRAADVQKRLRVPATGARKPALRGFSEAAGRRKVGRLPW